MMDLGKYREAIEYYTKALELTPENVDDRTLVDIWISKGNAFFELEDYQNAIKSYDGALQIDPENSEAWYFKGDCFRILEKRVEERVCYETALKYIPEQNISDRDDDILELKADILNNLGRYDEALECYSEIFERLDDDYKWQIWRKIEIAEVRKRGGLDNRHILP